MAKRVMLLNASLNMGGAEKMCFNLANELDRERFEPQACSMSEGDDLTPDFLAHRVPVHELPKPPGLRFDYSLKLARLLRRERIDIVHSHNFTPWLYAALAVAMTPGCRLVHTQHSDIDNNRPMPAPLRWLMQRVTSSAVAVSNPVAEHLVRERYSNESQTHLIYNGVPVGEPPAPHEGPFRFAIIARLVPVKNHAFLLRSFKRVCTQNAEAELHIVGDGPLMAELRALASELQLDERVVFRGQIQSASALLGEFDALVLSSLSEGLSISILEGMAAGLPLVATDVGGNGTLVADGQTGLLVPSEDEAAMSTALLALAEDRQLARQYGLAGHAAARERFSTAQMTARYAELYAAA